MSGKKSVTEEPSKTKKGRNRNEKRKDDKGRTLYEGVSQEASGMYAYYYYDKFHKRHKIRSWKLYPKDKVPNGKKDGKSLEELIDEIEKDLHDDIDRERSQKTTLNDRFDLYMQNKINIVASTRANYNYMYDRFVRDNIGRMAIDEITYSTIETFYSSLVKEKGLLPNSIDNIHTLLNPVFNRAVRDRLIRSNDCSFVMKDIRESKKWKNYSKSVSKKSLSANQQKALFDFLKSNEEHNEWLSIITVLNGTGLRIGECICLTWDNIDFDNDVIYVRNNLVYRQWEDGKCYSRVHDLKTENAERDIPMFSEVKKVLQEEYEKQLKDGFCISVVDGLSGFVFMNRYKKHRNYNEVNKALKRIVRDYNIEEEINAKKEKRKLKLMPHITNHSFRHTFCTRLAEMGVPIKTAQMLMGHGDVKTTLEVYTSLDKEHIHNSLKDYDDKMYLG